MAALKELLPPAKSTGKSHYDLSNDPWFKQRYSAAEAERSEVVKANPVPLYLKRESFRPSKPQDFGDGGAFPEIHYPQFPLDMGRKRDVNLGQKTLPVGVDKHWLSAAQPKNVPTQSSDSKFIKYKPSQQSAAFNSGECERIIRMVEMPVDPLEPPKFKYKRVPKASGSPPVLIMHSPPRPVTVKDQQDWEIPPCISNWKNPKGYTIPLDKRLAADGRGLQEVQINDNFAKLSEALYVAEQKAREAVEMRSKVQKERILKEKERKEQELRALAQKARSERTGAAPAAAVSMPSDRSIMDVDDMGGDYERKKERNAPRETKDEREERLKREGKDS
ncbi:hypothetical protein RJ639_015766 [Escallonia herrerae]|uniref:SKI-interacting protein SKIP SNW domain-containing protein n=1 Tax=Escallonia herrerae TaxID=1293975 RepID=A0AA88VDS6_9ASTE|nr:hypothetical protein RJ639_015766 [Escallonia herrerae]